MKSEQDLNYDILKMTMTIEELFPELSKYIGEMPVKILDSRDTEMNIEDLLSYYSSLDAVLKNYASYHTGLKAF